MQESAKSFLIKDLLRDLDHSPGSSAQGREKFKQFRNFCIESIQMR